jgi:hypothetical protein
MESLSSFVFYSDQTTAKDATEGGFRPDWMLLEPELLRCFPDLPLPWASTLQNYVLKIFCFPAELADGSFLTVGDVFPEFTNTVSPMYRFPQEISGLACKVLVPN